MAAGNGSIMRLALIPLYYANDPNNAVDYAARSSRTTHGEKEAVDACKYITILIINALKEVDKVFAA